MRGGTSKGVLFSLLDLPTKAQVAGAARDNILLRVIGSPDPYGKHTDGMGGATSSTSKVAVISASENVDHDVDYLFGQVAIDKAFIDWSGNCGTLPPRWGLLLLIMVWWRQNGFQQMASQWCGSGRLISAKPS